VNVEKVLSQAFAENVVSGPLSELISEWSLEFRDWSFFVKALTHSSYVHESSETLDSNERLEFLGDSVLGLAVSETLMLRGRDWSEGELSRLRSHFVSETRLAEEARRAKLGACLRMGKGERQSNGHERDAALADTVEALIGALYLDQGFDRCAQLIREKILPDLSLPEAQWETLAVSLLEKDAKSRLQEFLQQAGLGTPRYVCLNSAEAASTGPFEMALFLDDVRLATETAASKREATQHLARRLLAMAPQELVGFVAKQREETKGS
jgi:ribonuclease III